MTQQATVPTQVIGHQKHGTSYTTRQAVRAVVYNNDTDQVALIHIAKGNYYKLPGGGIEADEDHKESIQREILEETGCKISLNSALLLATSEEWRNDLHQTSFCYFAMLEKDTGKPDLTELESSEGLTHLWVDVKTAVEKMREVEPTSDLGRYIKERDLSFMEIFLRRRSELAV